MRRLGSVLIGAVLFLPLLAVGGAVMARDLWLMRRVRWARGRRP